MSWFQFYQNIFSGWYFNSHKMIWSLLHKRSKKCPFHKVQVFSTFPWVDLKKVDLFELENNPSWKKLMSKLLLWPNPTWKLKGLQGLDPKKLEIQLNHEVLNWPGVLTRSKIFKTPFFERYLKFLPMGDWNWSKTSPVFFVLKNLNKYCR